MNLIKKYNYIFFAIISLTVLLTSCSQDEVKVVTPAEEVTNLKLQKLQEFTRGDYTFYVYKKDTGNLVVGYNEVYIQLKNNKSGNYVENATLSWKPLMHMASMSHACPYSSIQKVSDTKTLYKGYFIFIMASDDTEYWEITYDYTSGNDTIVEVASRLTVNSATGRVRYKSFKGTDNVSYFLAMVEPAAPRVGTNDITAYLYKKVDMLTFNPVENYTVEIDPRMPDMDNHTSPNNVNLAYDAASGLYKGKLNLTMTGYWQVNLIVRNAGNAILKGDSITATTPASSIYFGIEF
ncbi:MAG: FixH family protein [Bacteroidota bacterium]|nr:FixH family protein [Bacteroidota bacterium]